MSTLTTQELQQQYIAYFGRPGDPQGIDYWLNNSDIKTAKEFALKISAQDEYANGIGAEPVADQVNALYVNLFGRNADADGLIYWTNQVKDGVLSLGNLAYDLIVAANNPVEGNEGQGALDALALAKKTAAAELFTENVKLGGFILDYDNEDAFAVARSFVSTVKADSQFTTEQLTTFTQNQVVAMSTAQAAAEAAAAQAEAAAANQLTPLQEAQLAAAQAQKAAADAELAVSEQAAADAAEAKAEAAAAAEAAKNADTAYKFTKTTDNLVGAGGADTFSGVIQAGTADGTTIFPGDSVDGGDGIDTVTVSVAGANPGGAYALSAITTDNVEKFLVSNFETTAPASANTFEAGLMTGLTTVGLNASSANGDTTFSLLKNFVDAEMRNGAGSLTLTYDGQQVITGEEDAQNLTVSAATAGTFTANGIETINVTSEINKSTLSGIASNQLKTLNISGDQNLKVTANGLVFVKVANGTAIDGTVDASAATGDINLNVGGSASTLQVTGGTGDDTFDFLGTLTKDDVVDGGDGTDTIEMNAAALSKQLNQVTNFEKFAFNPVTVDSTIKGDKVPASVSTFIVDAADPTATGGATITSTINKIPEGSSVVVKKTVKDSQGGTATDFGAGNGVIIALSEVNDTTTNEIDVTLDAIDVYTGATAGGGIADLQASNYETITLQSKKNKAGTITANEVGTVTAGSAKTITITGDADLTLNGLTGTKLTSLDASGLAGKLVLTTTGNNALARATYTAPSSQTTFNFGAGTLNYLDTIKGGSSSLDEVTGSVGSLTATTGDLDISDVETITLDTTAANTLDLTKVTGAKTLEVSRFVQTITGVDIASDLRIRADDVAGGAGDATLKITAADASGDADVLKVARRLSTNNDGANTIEVSDVETLDIQVEDTDNTATNTAVFTLSKFTGNSIIATEGSKDTENVNINLGTLNKSVKSIDTSGIKGTQAAVASAATSAVTFTGSGNAAVSFTGSEWADTFTISKTAAVAHTITGGVGTDTATVTTAAGFINPSGIAAENLNLIQTAGDDVSLSGVGSGNFNAATTKFTLTGGNSLSTFTHAAANAVANTVTNYDASGFGGNVVVTVAADALDDTLTLTGTGSTTDSVTASITNAGAGLTAKPKVIDIYTINLSTNLTGTATTTVDFSDSSGFKKISTNIGAADTFILDNLASGASLKVTDTGAAAVFNPKLADDSGTDDKLTIEVKGTGGAGGIDDNTTIQTSDVETLTIKSSTTGGESISLASVSMDAATATTTVKVTGSKQLTLSATHEDIATIDASGMSEGGSVVQTGRSRQTAVTYTGSDGADTFIMGHKDDVIDGGANPDGTTDTLDLGGTELLIGGAEVDLTKTDDVLVTFNGVSSSSAQSNFESVDLSNVTNSSTFGSIVTAHKSGSTVSGLNGGRDIIFGGAGNDNLSGNGGNDTIQGNAGNDTINGGAGNDTLVGGAGTNTYVYNTGDASTTEAIPDLGLAGATNNISVVTSENFDGDIIPNGGAAGDVLTGLNGISIAAGQGATFAGEQLTGLTVAVAGDGAGAAEVLTVNTIAAGGTTTLSGITHTGSATTIVGTANNDIIVATAGNDTITPGAGNDSLTIAGGTNVINYNTNDTSTTDAIPDLNSGGGTNTFNIVTTEDFDGNIIPNGGAANDVFTGLNAITIAANQTATFAGEQLTGLTLAVSGDGAGAAEVLTVNTIAAGGTTTLSGITHTGSATTIVGTANNDIIVATAGNDTITPGAGNDSLTIAGGTNIINYNTNDTSTTDAIPDLNSGGGTNTFNIVTSEDFDGNIIPNGGAANDVFTGLNAITIAANQTATFAGEQLTGLTVAVSGDGAGAAETLAITTIAAGGTSNFSGITHTGSATTITGTANADTITGTAGADRFLPGNGIDPLTLGGGRDTVVYTGVTAAANANNISAFVVGASGDIIEIAAAGYSYTAGTPTVTNVAGITGGAGGAASAREILIDTQANILAANKATEYSSSAALAVATDTGAIIYDADGNFTGGTHVVIGTITGGATLTADNFTIV